MFSAVGIAAGTAGRTVAAAAVVDIAVVVPELRKAEVLVDRMPEGVVVASIPEAGHSPAADTDLRPELP